MAKPASELISGSFALLHSFFSRLQAWGSAPQEPFSIDRRRLLHTGAAIEREAPLIVRLPTQKWSYAIPFPRVTKAGWVNRPSVVSVTFRGDGGQVGIGCLREDGSTFVDEVVCEASDLQQRVQLYIPEPDLCASLMVRNAGAARSVRIDAIHVEALKDEVERGQPRRRSLEPLPNWRKYYGHRFSSLDDKVRARRYAGLREPMDIPWLDDLRLRIYPRNQMSRAIYISGVYEPNTMLALSRLLASDGVVLDIEANMGCFTLFAARRLEAAGRVFAFEPSSRDRARLIANVDLNRLKNVSVSREAVGESDGQAELLVAEDERSGHNTLGTNFGYAQTQLAARETVPVVKLDSFVAREGLDRVDVIKIDIEGGEYSALRGCEAMLARWHPALILEVVPASPEAGGRTARALERLLREHGYHAYEIDESDATLVPMQSLDVPRSTNIVCIHDGSAQTAV